MPGVRRTPARRNRAPGALRDDGTAARSRLPKRARPVDRSAAEIEPTQTGDDWTSLAHLRHYTRRDLAAARPLEASSGRARKIGRMTTLTAGPAQARVGPRHEKSGAELGLFLGRDRANQTPPDPPRLEKSNPRSYLIAPPT